ncbi:MAG: lytic transglycosylase domain-containing protein [Deltaproteobacteria bacterium]|jgi:soluble lytic murein transglycosylase-like protein|nr:lytic transglycosylase domain-containing protein [Deltaproteobacteria bacterium]
MNTKKISLAIASVGLKVCLAGVAVGMAYVAAFFEHQARVDSIQPPAGEIVSEKPPAQTVVAFADSLKPDLSLLAKIKEQSSAKPVFDKKLNNYENMIHEAAKAHQVSPALIKAVIQAESRFNAQAVSSQGAVGLMQILPSTARSMGVSSPLEPYDNITAGVRYLKTLLKEFNDDEYLALAAYNCGPDAIRRYGNNMPPFRETKTFVAKVMEYYTSYIDS